MRPTNAFIATCLAVCLAAFSSAGCASAELPDGSSSSDTGLADDAGTDTPDTAVEDVDEDAALPEDTSDDTQECVPSTCEELEACGMVGDGCGGSLDCGECPEVAEVHISPGDHQVLQVGDTLELSATASGQGGGEVFCEFGWSSLDATIARVDASGRVSGLKPGITEIRVDCRGTTDRVRVYINDSGLPSTLTDAEDLAMWFRADVGLNFSGGAQVEEWEDLSGNAYKLANDNFSRHPRRVSDVVNGHPVLRFTGTHELRTTTSHVSLPQATIFAVLTNNEASHRGQILSNCTEAGNNQLRFDGSETGLYFYGAENGLDTSATLDGATTTPHLLTVVLSTSELRVRQNGQPQTSVPFSAQGSWHLGQIGARCSSEYLRGDIAEIMVYRRVLDSSELQSVEAYLTSRYGL